MAKKYRKIFLWDMENKWVPINRLSNIQLIKYLIERKTDVSVGDGLTPWVIPAETVVDMAKLAVRRKLTPPQAG